MTTQIVLTRIQKLIWVYIYGGLLAIVLASFLGPNDASTVCWLRVVGGAFVALGVVLIFVRSRLKLTEPPAGGPK
jgi:hypothetical protein